MDEQKRWIKQKLSKGHFRLTIHALERMNQRMIHESDIVSCGKTAKKIELQENKGTWKVIGKDLDLDKLTIICKVQEGVLIITAY